MIVELEQAGDSAKVAAEADTGASADSRKLVDLAHHAICVLKHELPNRRASARRARAIGMGRGSGR